MKPVAPLHTAAGKRTAPWALSALAHLAVIIAAFFVVWTVRPAPDDDEPSVAVSFDNPALGSAAEAPSADDLLSVELPPLDADDLPPAQTDPLDALEALMPTETPLELPAAPPPSVALRAPASVAGAEFAGLGASDARDIVYVVDASGSMITTLPEVRAELRRSIEALHPTQRFTVLLFRNERGGGDYAWPTAPVNARKPVLLDATRDNKQAVLEWVERERPRGRSNPAPAIEAALAMKPDAVFVLSSRIAGAESSDADLDGLMNRLDALNPVHRPTGRRRVTIKTIQILEDDPQGALRAIGETHGGSDGYKFLSREALERRAAAAETNR